MDYIDIIAIERQARHLRAEEMRRLSGILATRSSLVLGLMGRSLAVLGRALSEALRPLFSWNPRELHPH